jgi:hypothetical protein
MISPKRIYGKITSPDLHNDATTILLLLCMRLVTSHPTDTLDARTPLYWATKQFYALVEATPLLSLQLLQAQILLSVYEIGHGIFPTAFTSVGHAARLLRMTGLHDTKRASRMFRPPPTWTGREEERRVCWSVLILDRYVVFNDVPALILPQYRQSGHAR